jgi:short-subunit dehydrogenase
MPAVKHPTLEHPWSSALVTGASSGIGAALARRLAGARVPLVLVARRADLLEGLARELRAGPGATGAEDLDVEVLVADLTDRSDLDRVAARLADDNRPIDLLVNNAGLGSSGPFADGSIDTYRQIIDLNVEALVELSHAAVGPMVSRRRGWIMNMSSLGGHAPGPGFAVYSATKAFVTSFSESLHEEVRRSGVVITAVCPGATRTEFGDRSGAETANLPSLLLQDADEVASEALTAAAAGRAVRVTGRVNRVSAALTTVLPRSANRRLATLVTDQL